MRVASHCQCIHESICYMLYALPLENLEYLYINLWLRLGEHKGLREATGFAHCTKAKRSILFCIAWHVMRLEGDSIVFSKRALSPCLMWCHTQTIVVFCCDFPWGQHFTWHTSETVCAEVCFTDLHHRLSRAPHWRPFCKFQRYLSSKTQGLII